MVTIDPTVPETPPGSGIRWDSQGQQWVDTHHGNQPWNSATQTWGPSSPTITPAQGSPSLGAQQAGANIDLTRGQAGAVVTDAAATTANAAANTANAATNATNARNTAARNQQLHDEALAAQGLTQQQINNQFTIDSGTLGVARANELRQERQDAATALRNQQLHEETLAAQGLTQQQITNSYNSDVAKYGIDRASLLLNSRQAAAKSLIDSANFQLAQNAQNAQSRQTMAAQQLDALKLLQARSGPQDYTKWDYITGMGGNAPKPQDSRTYSPLDMIAAQYQPSNIAAPAGFDTSGLDVGNYPAAASAQPVSGTATTIQPSSGGGQDRLGGGSAGAATGDFTADLQASRTTGVPGLASGGTTAGAAIVGDAKSGKPTGHEEVAYASNNPQSGVAELHVIPHHMLAGMIDEATGRKGGLVLHANKVPKEMTHLLPRAASGGVFGQNGDNSQGTASPSDSGGLPQYQPSAGTTISPDPSTGAPQQFTGPITTGFDSGGAPTTQPATGGGTLSPAATSAPAQPGTTPSAVGGVYSGSTAAPPPQSLGPAGYDPYRITVNQYSPQVMNDSPLLRMLRGQQSVYGFQGQGNYQPGIESQGITNLPIGLNYGDYLRMDPTRQSLTKALYDNPETGESFDQILAMAKAAAPKVGNFRVASAR